MYDTDLQGKLATDFTDEHEFYSEKIFSDYYVIYVPIVVFILHRLTRIL